MDSSDHRFILSPNLASGDTVCDPHGNDSYYEDRQRPNDTMQSDVERVELIKQHFVIVFWVVEALKVRFW